MPFVRSAVRPVHVRRGALARAGVTLGGEHEAAVNGSLARAMEQIADLSLIADRLFRELLLECVVALDRAEQLSRRTRRLQGVADSLELTAPITADSSVAKHELDYISWTDNGTVDAIAYEQETGLFTPATRPDCVVLLYRSLSAKQQPLADAGAAHSAVFCGDEAGAAAMHLSGFDQCDVEDSHDPSAVISRVSMQPVFTKGGPTVVEPGRSKVAAHRHAHSQRRRTRLELQPPARTRCLASSEPTVLASEEQLRRCTLPTPEQRQALAVGLLPAPEVVAISTSRSSACGSLLSSRSKTAQQQLRGQQRDLSWLPASKEGLHYQTLPARRGHEVDPAMLYTQAGHVQARKPQQQLLPWQLGVADGLRIPPLASLSSVNLQPSTLVLAKDPSAYLYETDTESNAYAVRDRQPHSQRLADCRGDERAEQSGCRSRSSIRRSQLIGRLRRSLSLPKGFERRTLSPSRYQRDVGSAAMAASDYRDRTRPDTVRQAMLPLPSALIDDRAELVYVNFYGAPNTDLTSAMAHVAVASQSGRIKHSQSEHGQIGTGHPSIAECVAETANDASGSMLQGLQLRSRSHGQIDQCLVSSSNPRSNSGAKFNILSKGLRPKSLSSDRLHGLLVAPGTRGGGGGDSKLGVGSASRLSRTLSGFFRRKQATSAAALPDKQHGSHGGLAAVACDDVSGSKGKSKSRNRLSQLFAGMGIAGSGSGGVLLRKRDSKATSSSSGRWSGSERYSVGSDAGGCCQATTTLSQSRLSKLSADRDSAVSEGSLPRGGDHTFDSLSLVGTPTAVAAGAVGEHCLSLGTFSSAGRCAYADLDHFGVTGHVLPFSSSQLPQSAAAAHTAPDALLRATTVQTPPTAATRRSDTAELSGGGRQCRCCRDGVSSSEVVSTAHLGRRPEVVSDEHCGRCVLACEESNSSTDGRSHCTEAGTTAACDRSNRVGNFTNRSSSDLLGSGTGAQQQQEAAAVPATRRAADGYCTLPRPGRFRFTVDLSAGNVDASSSRWSEVTQSDFGSHDYRSLPRHLTASRVTQSEATKREGVASGMGRQQQQQQQQNSELSALGMCSAKAPAVAVAASVALQSPDVGSSGRFVSTSEADLDGEDDPVATTAALSDVPAMPEVVPPSVLCSLVSPFGQSRFQELRRASYRRSLSPGSLETPPAAARLPAGDSALVSSLIQEARSMSAASSPMPQQPSAATEPSPCAISIQREHCSENGNSSSCFVRRASYRVAVTKVQSATSGAPSCNGVGGTPADLGNSLAVSSSRRSSVIASRFLTNEHAAAADAALAASGGCASSDLAAEEHPVDREDDADGSNSFIRSYSYRLANRSSTRHRQRVVAPSLPTLAARRSMLLFETDCEQSLSPQSPSAMNAGHEMHVSGDAKSSHARPASVVAAATASSTTTTLDWSMLPTGDSCPGNGDACLEIACRVRFTGRLGSAFSSSGISSSLSHLNAVVCTERMHAGTNESDHGASQLSSAADGATALPLRMARERPRSTFFPKGDVNAELVHGLLALQQRCHADGSAAGAFTSLEMLRQDERMLLSLMDVVAASPPSPGIPSSDLAPVASDLVS